MKNKIKSTLITVLPLLAFFALWEIGSHYAPRGVLPPPTKIVPATLKAFTDPNEQLLYHTMESFKRIGLGFLLAGYGVSRAKCSGRRKACGADCCPHIKQA